MHSQFMHSQFMHVARIGHGARIGHDVEIGHGCGIGSNPAPLVDHGVEFVDDVIVSRSSPAYRIAQLDEAKRELLESATKDARRRADVLVTGSGSKVGSLLEASQGMFEVTSPDNPESDFDTTSINKVIRVVVTLRFEITKE